MPLTGSNHTSMAILCVLTCYTFQKEIDNLVRYRSDQRETLWYLQVILAKPISPHHHLVYRFLRTGNLAHSSFDPF